MVVALSGCNALLGITDPTAATPPTDGQPGSDAPIDMAIDANPNRKLVSVTISPEPVTFALGLTQQLEATANYDDNSHDVVTTQATWAITSGTAATVSPTGLLTSTTEGTVEVQAVFDGKAGLADATVGPKAADHVLISVGNMTLMTNQRALIRAEVVFTDQSKEDVTFSAAWTTDNTAIVPSADFGDLSGIAAGTATVSAAARGVTGSIVVTVTAVPCHLVINEVQTGSAASAADEWVEVFNPCTTAVDVTGFTLDYRSANANGATDTNLMVTLSGSIQPLDTKLFCGGSVTGVTCDGSWASGFMQQNNGGVGLRNGPKDTGPIVDAAAYGSVLPGHPFIEGTVAPALSNGKVMARLPFDGHDQDNNIADFVLTTASTPNALNFP